MKQPHPFGGMRRAVSTTAAAALAASTALAATLVPAPTAQACGGFFCNQSSPVNQQAEEIIFVDNGDETTTMVVRIQYQGPAEKFAWLLPVPGVPEVAVSANLALDRLRSGTDPLYNLQREIEGECAPEPPAIGGPGCPNCGGLTPAAAPAEMADMAVMVLDEGSVGPFDYATIAVDSEHADAAQAAVDWLFDNDYDVTDVGADVLRPYLAEGLNLIAFRLTKGNMVGSIRPVMLTYAGDKPSIPIRPTAVAAQPDMGIRVWTLSGAQAIPKNYKALVINEALINWFNYQANYDQVITEAANQAGGQGFVTEMAGDSGALDELVFTTFDAQEWMSYSLQDFRSGIDAMQEARWRYASWDGWRDVVCDNLREGVDCDVWSGTQNPADVAVDGAGFVRELFERVIKPVIDTQRLLLSRPYVTRMYSTMSADEMTLDPSFDWNADLADVDRVHTARQIIECSPEVGLSRAPYRIELPQGGVVRGEGDGGFGGSWPIALGAMPANLAIVQLTTQGAGEIVEDNREMILEALFEQSGERHSGSMLQPMPDDGVPIGGMVAGDPTSGSGRSAPAADDAEGTGEPDDDGAAGNGSSGGGSSGLCATRAPGLGGTGTGSAAGLLLLAAIAGWRRGNRRHRCGRNTELS